MIQGFVTVIVPFAADRSRELTGVVEALGNPARSALATRLDEAAFVHFMSMIIVPAREDESNAHLVIEVCADGHPKAALARLANAIPDVLSSLLAVAEIDLTNEPLGALLEARRKEFGLGWFRIAGLAFAGTPGMSVERITDEARLATRLREVIDKDVTPSPALDKLERARSVIFADSDLKWAFVCEPVPLLGEEKPVTDSLGSLVKAAIRDFLWPLSLPPVLVFLYSCFITKNPLDIALWHVVLSLLAVLLIAGFGGLAGYRILRRQEKADVPFDAEPQQEDMREILNRENALGVVQNHLAGVSTLKPGWVRRVTLRGALWLIGEHGTRRSKPGFIDKIGTIHFARWLRLPGTDRLLFLSNYDGSWQSYLEDFIARLREGLTSVWSNTCDFPKTTNLRDGGASDGARFKRWARRQQLPTPCWYSAYPELTTTLIRTNAAIRHGFAGASNEQQAAKWLALFGYAAPDSVEAGEVPTLAFGALSGLPHAHCLVIELGQVDKARRWLLDIESEISYGDRKPQDRALVVAFTCSGLGKLGLDERTMATFPTAFQHGMSAPARARALGDEPRSWRWGGPKTKVDALLLLYAADAKTLFAQMQYRTQQLEKFAFKFQEILLSEVPQPDSTSKRIDMREPFGFRDGISQPIMRGSRTQAERDHPMDVVEPGELLLGYRDNLGNVAPVPQCNGSDIGRNGTFLVVRQLEQDVTAFHSYVDQAARGLHGDSRVPKGVDLCKWVGAKMVGRWHDGTSLVQYPLAPGTDKIATLGPDNDFQYGRDDPDGLRCPLGAHIRRANPRDSFDPGSQTQIAISNRHRILRVGRNYRPASQGGNPGLLFMCVNADIERQFEFLQQTWLLDPSFHGLSNEIDPIVGYRGSAEMMTVPTLQGPVRLEALAKFVTVLGGGYFFMPGRSAVRMLAG